MTSHLRYYAAMEEGQSPIPEPNLHNEMEEIPLQLHRTLGTGPKVHVKGNVFHHPTGKMSKSYPMREGDNFLRRNTGVDFNRRPRGAILNPTIMPEVVNASPQGCGFMSDRERDLQYA